MSYNIFEGGLPRKTDQTRNIIEVIRHEKPDVVGLCECTGFLENGNARLRLFEQELGMNSIINIAPSGEHVAVFFRPHLPVVSTAASSVTMYHGFATISLDLSPIGRTSITMTHLHPRSSLFRMAEAQNVLSKATFDPNALVMGDFNSLSERDVYSDLDELSLNAQIRLFNADGHPVPGVAQYFEQWGFVDLGAGDAIPTYPTKLFGKSGRGGTGLRLDYMFGTSRLAKIAKLSTVNSSSSQRASDHLPLVCDLALVE